MNLNHQQDIETGQAIRIELAKGKVNGTKKLGYRQGEANAKQNSSKMKKLY